MQAILIVLPIFAYALLVGIALAYVLFARSPRPGRRRIRKRGARNDPALCPPRQFITRKIDTDQTGHRRNS